MKRRKIIIIIVILLVSCLLIVFINNNSKYLIPDNYIDKIVDNRSYVDGPDKTIYVYNDKIIVEEDDYFPDGQFLYRHCKSITVYKGISDPNEIDEVKWIVIFKKFNW